MAENNFFFQIKMLRAQKYPLQSLSEEPEKSLDPHEVNLGPTEVNSGQTEVKTTKPAKIDSQPVKVESKPEIPEDIPPAYKPPPKVECLSF